MIHDENRQTKIVQRAQKGEVKWRRERDCIAPSMAPWPMGRAKARQNLLSLQIFRTLSLLISRVLITTFINIIKNHPKGGFVLWRRERDSNPRWSYKPHTPLAGERLQPLGHLSEPLSSKTSDHSKVQRLNVNNNLRCTPNLPKIYFTTRVLV